MANISETELQRRLRALEKGTSGSGTNTYVRDVDPYGSDYKEGDAWYNSATNNLWLFSNGWGLTFDKLHFRYADEVLNVDTSGHTALQSDITGFSPDPFTVGGVQKKWRGTLFGPANASTDSTDYTWSLTAGEDGYTPIKGFDYDDGDPGVDSYLHVKYSDDGGVTLTGNDGEDIGNWIGQYTDDVETDSLTPSFYTWAKFIPEKGVEYDDGIPAYFHIKYSNDGGVTFTATSGETIGNWIGTLVDSTAADSLVESDYTWVKFIPEKGTEYDDGDPGTSAYMHIKYSNDGGTTFTANGGEDLGNWIGTLVDETLLDSTDPADYTWAKFVPEKGVDYDDGGRVAQITIYQRSASTLSTPTGGSYNFDTNTVVTPSGWGNTIPAGTDPLYACLTIATVSGSQTSDTTLTWSNPEILVHNGIDGTLGTSVYTTNVFMRKASAPNTPVSNTGSFNFGANTLTAPTGSPSSDIWEISIPTGTDPLYASEATFSISGDTGTDTAVTWGSPRVIAQDGASGLDGLSTYLFSIFQRSLTTPSTPTGGSYNFTTNTPTVPSGWSESVPSGTDPLFVSSTLASVDGPTGTDNSLTWKTPVIMSQDGNDGSPGADGVDGNDGSTAYFHIKYSDDNGVTFTGNGGEDVGAYIGTYSDHTAADSTVLSDYTWKKIVGETPSFERYYTTTAGLASEIGDPTTPGSGVTWVLTTGSAPATAYWIAERYTINGVTSDWQIYPVQAKDGGLPFIKASMLSTTAPTLGDSTWISHAILAVEAWTGRDYSTQKEFGYGTVVVIDYNNGVTLSGRYIRLPNGNDDWVAPGTFIDGDLIVDGTIAASHIQATSIDATKLVISGTNAIDAGTVGADPVGSASTAQTNAASDATTKANDAQTNAEATASGDATAKVAVVTGNIYTTGTTTIDGGKVTTGSISSDQIDANTITANEIASGAITADLIDINNYIEFSADASGLRFTKTGLADTTEGLYLGRGLNPTGSSIAGIHVGDASRSFYADTDGNVRLQNVDIYVGPAGSPSEFTSSGTFEIPAATTTLNITLIGGGGGGPTNAAGDLATSHRVNGGAGSASTIHFYTGSNGTGTLISASTITATGGAGGVWSVGPNNSSSDGAAGEDSSAGAGGQGGVGTAAPGNGSRGSGGGSGGSEPFNYSNNAPSYNGGMAGQTVSYSIVRPPTANSMVITLGAGGAGGVPLPNNTPTGPGPRNGAIVDGGDGGMGYASIADPLLSSNSIDLEQMELDIQALQGGGGTDLSGTADASGVMTHNFNTGANGGTAPSGTGLFVLYGGSSYKINGYVNTGSSSGTGTVSEYSTVLGTVGFHWSGIGGSGLYNYYWWRWNV